MEGAGPGVALARALEEARDKAEQGLKGQSAMKCPVPAYTVCNEMSVCYAMSGTDIQLTPIELRHCYAMSDTEIHSEAPLNPKPDTRHQVELAVRLETAEQEIEARQVSQQCANACVHPDVCGCSYPSTRRLFTPMLHRTYHTRGVVLMLVPGGETLPVKVLVPDVGAWWYQLEIASLRDQLQGTNCPALIRSVIAFYAIACYEIAYGPTLLLRDVRD
eukprot:2402151-Rhodomonas_salina.4